MVHVLQPPWSKEPRWEEHLGIRIEVRILGKELVGHLEHLEEHLEEHPEEHSYQEGIERVGSLDNPDKGMEDNQGQERR